MENKKIIFIILGVWLGGISILILVCLGCCYPHNCDYMESESYNTILKDNYFNSAYCGDSIVSRKCKVNPISFGPFHFSGRMDSSYIYIIENDNEKKILDTHLNTEDPRVFETRDSKYPWIITWVETIGSNPSSIKLYAGLMDKGKNITNKIQLKTPESEIQKNWILINSNNLKETLWSCWYYPKHIVYQVDMFTGDTNLKYESDSSPEAQKIRGGTNYIEYGDKLYAIGHKKSIVPYKISCILYSIENSPPYKISKVSNDFTFSRNKYIEYPTSIKKEGNDKLKILLGIEDKNTVEVTVDKNKLISLIDEF